MHDSTKEYTLHHSSLCNLKVNLVVKPDWLRGMGHPPQVKQDRAEAVSAALRLGSERSALSCPPPAQRIKRANPKANQA